MHSTMLSALELAGLPAGAMRDDIDADDIDGADAGAILALADELSTRRDCRDDAN